jgi:CRISPR-associated protein Cas1
MPTLYVTEPYATLRLSGDSLLVTAEIDPDGKAGPEPARRQTLLDVEPHRLELIALVGNTHITSDALRLCLEKGIAVAWFAWNGKYLGRIMPEAPKSADLRLLQYAAASDPATRLARARGVVSAKLLNAAEVLENIQSNDSDNAALGPAIAELKRLKTEAEAADTAERLLGLEGTGAREYFAAFGASFRTEITFTSRQRRPPPDPANALLSFGYVLLGNLLGGMMEARGLDPALGFFHELHPGRPSLALDLLEELRAPVVDRFVLRSCNLRIFRPQMFEPDPENSGGVRLTRDALKTFFREWEKHLLRPLRCRASGESLPVAPLLRRQIERLVSDLRGTAPYQPFHYGD